MADHKPLKGLRALVVEDEYFVAEDVKSLLRRHGADFVKLSGSSDDAMRQIQGDVFGFALLDINMRGEMAFFVADEFVRRKIPFAFVSGYDRSIIPLRFAMVPNWGKPYEDRQIVGGIVALWTRPPKA